MSEAPPPVKRDPYAALRIRDFSFYLGSRFTLTLAVQIQSVVAGFLVFNMTGDPLDLGYIGLAEAVPFIAISLFAGYLADIIRRKTIILWATGFLTLCALALAWLAYQPELMHRLGTGPIFGIVFCTGLARGFLGPVFPAFLSQLVPRSLYANAATWQSTTWQTAAIAGQSIGGLLAGFVGTDFAFAVSFGLVLLSFLFMTGVKNHPLPPREVEEKLSQKLTAGFRFVFRNQIMLSAFSLDLFAVFFGGAVAMIPAFTNVVFHLDKQAAGAALGFLRAAPGIGAILMGLFLAWFPPTRKAGRNLYIAVLGFGACIIGFALSQNLWLSFFLLLLSGAFDSISVVIRSTILQLMTPDHMRGRVSAVWGIFIGSSNEIGEFESGVAAHWLGIVPSVIFGGCMTMVVTIGVFFLAPKLRKINLERLD